MGYVVSGIGVGHVTSSAVSYNWAVNPTSSGVWNSDGVVIEVYWDGGVLYRETHRGFPSGRAGNVAITGLASGRTVTARIRTFDARNPGNSDWTSGAAASGTTTYSPVVTQAMFTQSALPTTVDKSKALVNYANLGVVNNERMSYNYRPGLYRLEPAGKRSGTVELEDFTFNTSSTRQFGLVRNDGNGGPYVASITKTVWPSYKDVVTTPVGIEEINDSTIYVYTQPWRDIGNIPYTATILIKNETTGVNTTYPVNLTRGESWQFSLRKGYTGSAQVTAIFDHPVNGKITVTSEKAELKPTIVGWMNVNGVIKPIEQMWFNNNGPIKEVIELWGNQNGVIK